MSTHDPYYDKYKAQMSLDRQKLEEKFREHAPMRRCSGEGRPSDDVLHQRAFEMMEKHPQGNLQPRRDDTLKLVVVPKP